MLEERTEGITTEELQLAARNHGMPLEALRYPITPVGLHYLLIHYDIPAVDPAAWRLEIGGDVRTPLSLSLDDLMARPVVTMPITFECAGNGRARLTPRPISQPWLTEAVGTAEWTGTPLAPLLRETGLSGGAVDVVFTGMDRGIEKEVEQDYARALPVAEALRDDVLMAYAVDGQPLPPQHGFPLRLVVPGWYGMTNVKWLHRIEVTSAPFEGFQNVSGYRYRTSDEDPGEPVTRMMPRALMVPPGIPEFMTRVRRVRFGPVRLDGKAWSGWGPIERVEVSHDGGTTWSPATLDDDLGPNAWRSWSSLWEPDRTGWFELACRAFDAAGNAQPDQPRWNAGGYANNAVQRVTVEVVPAP